MSFATLNLGGNVGEVQERTLENGTTIFNISIATTKSVKKNDTWENVTVWHRVTLFNKSEKQAAYTRGQIQKGSVISVVCDVDYNTIEKEGVKTTYNQFTVKEWVAAPKSDGNAKSTQKAAPKASAPTVSEPGDDLPF